MAQPNFNVGAAVFTADGRVFGEIQRVTDSMISVSRDHQTIEVPLTMIDEQRSSSERTVLLSSFSPPTASISIHAEELTTDVREVERGSVRIEKSVEYVPIHKDVDLTSDVMHIERVPMDQVFDEKPESRQDGERLVIPVVEEVLVLTRRYRVIEEVRVTRQQQTHTERFEADLRREVVDVRQVDADGNPVNE